LILTDELQERKMMWIKEWLPSVRDLFQTAFFITIGILTLLTYLKAKKTLLQPIRTEIFKEQLKVFSDILRFFTGKNEIELREDFEFDKLLYVNTTSLYDIYASHFYGISFDENERPYRPTECPMARVSQETMEEDFQLAVDYKVHNRTRNKASRMERTKADFRSQYKYGMIKIPREFVTKEEEFQRIMDSPLLPKALVELLDDYIETIHKNLRLVGDVLTECAREMPDKYSDLEELKEASFLWIANRYNERFEHLEGRAKGITNYLREYFTIDKLMEH
jgi:hypothetical protein